MESREEVMGPKDQTHIVKGKRTKRQRPQSPIPFTIATNSSSGDGGGYGSNGDEMMMMNNQLHNTNSPPATTSGEFAVDTATEEEEDMANCLILLAQGHSRQWANPKYDDHDQDHDHHHHHHHHHHHDNSTYKFTSKRYLETPSTTGNGKVGIYVYQCKTCSRTFPSFQALGGHRASHKKPKLAAPPDEKKKTVALSDDEEPLSLQLSSSTKALFGSSSGNKLKIHECSICGAEFSSGQALGGHMRRHRGPAVAANTALSLTPAASAPPQPQPQPRKPRNGLSLSLDLNLPAPEDHDHHRESKLAFPSKQHPSESKFALTSKQQQQQQQQSPLVLSATPTLVDCHY